MFTKRLGSSPCVPHPRPQAGCIVSGCHRSRFPRRHPASRILFVSVLDNCLLRSRLGQRGRVHDTYITCPAEAQPPVAPPRPAPALGGALRLATLLGVLAFILGGGSGEARPSPRLYAPSAGERLLPLVTSWDRGRGTSWDKSRGGARGRRGSSRRRSTSRKPQPTWTKWHGEWWWLDKITTKETDKEGWKEIWKEGLSGNCRRYYYR